MYQKENLYNKFKKSLIKDKDVQLNIENNGKELLDNIFPDINDNLYSKNEELNLFKNNEIKSPRIKNEEYFDYKSKKLKLFNLYNQLLDFRKKLIIKEKELIKKEKNLLEFESVLKTNESILRNNIEQFDIYIKQNINEIKNQFKQIETLQINRENYLKQKEEEIIHFTNKLYHFPKNFLAKNNNSNSNHRHLACNCDLCNEEKIIKPFIDSYLSEFDFTENDNTFDNTNDNNHYKTIDILSKNHSSYNSRNKKYLTDINHQKNNSVNIIHSNSSIFDLRKDNCFEKNKRKNICGRKINNIYDNLNDLSRLNYTCCCQGCKFCCF